MRNMRFTLLMFSFLLPGLSYADAAQRCLPTPSDEVGPFYKPRAPVRAKIGSGYVLSGSVRSAVTCLPIAGARIELWQTAPSGDYDDAHRATIFSDRNGQYRLETDYPSPYVGRPPHIHILVESRNHAVLITQHYPLPRARAAIFDLVLLPD